MDKFKLIIFDVDGVLLDSLTPHLEICRDQNTDLNLNLTIPTNDEFRSLVACGTKISPMYDFFLAIGFPPKEAKSALSYYEESFADDYSVNIFGGILDLLTTLSKAGIELGIVTSNVMKNIESPLYQCLPLFKKEFIFTKDQPKTLKKHEAIEEIIVAAKVKNTETLYVGDQPSDRVAANNANVSFVGVTYGWGIQGSNHNFPTAHNIQELKNILVKLV